MNLSDFLYNFYCHEGKEELYLMKRENMIKNKCSPIRDMLTKKIHQTNDIDVKWPSEELVDSIGFQTKAGNRIKDFLKEHGIEEITLRGFIDLFLPPLSKEYKTKDEFWISIPIMRQSQFGPYLYDSALLTLTESDVCTAFQTEWILRIFSLQLHELRNKPANKRLQQTAHANEIHYINNNSENRLTLALHETVGCW